jgi:hypothetical protein
MWAGGKRTKAARVFPVGLLIEGVQTSEGATNTLDATGPASDGFDFCAYFRVLVSRAVINDRQQFVLVLKPTQR